MMIRLRLIPAFAALLVAASAIAQPQNETRIAAPREPDALPLYGDKTPGSHSDERWTTSNIGLGIRNVTRPTITPMLPARGRANGAAVVIAPGGAFVGLAWEHEGIKTARELTRRGYTAFILKYRVRPTPDNDAELARIVGPLIQEAMRNPDRLLDQAWGPAVEDGRQAVAWVRANAARYRVDPARVGMIGYSAGAMTALATVLQGEGGQVPDFFGYIYGPQLTVQVPANAPPMFAAQALDDQLFKTRGIPLVEAWQSARRPVELHVYQQGGHGFGIGYPGQTNMAMIDQFTAWLAMQGLDKPRAAK